MIWDQDGDEKGKKKKRKKKTDSNAYAPNVKSHPKMNKRRTKRTKKNRKEQKSKLNIMFILQATSVLILLRSRTLVQFLMLKSKIKSIGINASAHTCIHWWPNGHQCPVKPQCCISFLLFPLLRSLHCCLLQVINHSHNNLKDSKHRARCNLRQSYFSRRSWVTPAKHAKSQKCNIQAARMQL